MELRASLEKYRECSLSVIDIIEKENYDKLEAALVERQQILDSINELKFTKEEINEIVDELQIINISKELDELVMNKKNTIKSEMVEMSAKKNASNKYGKNPYSSSMVFSKKV